MSQTDRQTDTAAESTTKTSRWAFTAYEGQFGFFREGNIPANCAEWGWNTEKCPDTGRIHYQGYLRTKQQCRLSALQKQFPGVHFEPARNWAAVKNYSGKVETRVPGTEPVSETSTIPDIYAYSTIVARRLPDREQFEAMFEAQTAEMYKHKAKGEAPNYERYHVRNHHDFVEYLVDIQVRLDITQGRMYAAHIATNPQWISLWRKYGLEILQGKNLM